VSIVNLATPKAGAKHELLFNKSASGPQAEKVKKKFYNVVNSTDTIYTTTSVMLFVHLVSGVYQAVAQEQ
jgi:hypothetical protein